ncbi:MAG: hypothetical protein RQ767_03765 [Thermovirgaceae bacterium]|nr:hypothetical protein [Thermovirgaceae bacterium]
MNMKRMIVCLTIIVAVMVGIQGVVFAAGTGDQLWLRTMTRECIQGLVETGVAAEDAEMYAQQYQFMAMTMQGRVQPAEEEAGRVGNAFGMVLGTALAQQGLNAMTDSGFAFMSAVRAGMAPEAAAAAEVQMLRSRYTIQDMLRVMTRATEMIRSMQPEDDGTALGEMIRTMAQNRVTTEKMTQTMGQSGQGAAEAAGAGSGSGTSAGAGSGESGAGSSGSGADGSGNGSGQGSGNGK